MHEIAKIAVIIEAKCKKCEFYWKISQIKKFLDRRMVLVFKLPDYNYLRLPMHTRWVTVTALKRDPASPRTAVGWRCVLVPQGPRIAARYAVAGCGSFKNRRKGNWETPAAPKPVGLAFL